MNKMDLAVNGESKRALQIGTVMTHPEQRGKGLSKQLMEYVSDTYRNRKKSSKNIHKPFFIYKT